MSCLTVSPPSPAAAFADYRRNMTPPTPPPRAKHRFKPKAPPVAPEWMTDDADRDARFLFGLAGDWAKAQDRIRAVMKAVPYKSKSRVAEHLRAVERIVDDRARKETNARSAERTRRVDLRDKRKALAVTILKWLCEEPPPADPADPPDVRAEPGEVEPIRVLLGIIDSDSPGADMAAMFRAALKAGNVDASDVLGYAIDACDAEMKEHYDKGDFMRMNWRAEDGAKLAAARKALES